MDWELFSRSGLSTHLLLNLENATRKIFTLSSFIDFGKNSIGSINKRSPCLLENSLILKCRLPLVLAESGRMDEQTEYNHFYSYYHTADT